MHKFRFLLLATFAVLAVSASAQTTTGLITGAVTDASGAVVPDAQVEVVNSGTDQHRTTTTGANGIYQVPRLQPGMYEVSVSKDGFAIEKRKNVKLEVNQSVTLDFALSVSGTSQTVTVTEAPPPLNTTSATLGDVINHETTVSLPLNGRQFTQLTLLTPGAVPQQAGQQSANLVPLGAGGVVPSVNGQRPRQNNFTMDGVLNNYVFANTWAISPPPDALEEFNVQSHITDAQFAISSGANINIVSRSGTNQFHGTLWEFIRNDAFDAATFPSTKKLPYHQNQYGVYFGGPVLLPKWDGRNNTWFSVYWEGFRSKQVRSAFATVPTAAMKAGDFSALLGTTPIGTDSLGRRMYANEIYDPTTSRPDPTNPSATVRDPFPGNIIPAGQINKAASLILGKYYPDPNLTVGPNQPNLLFDAATITKSDQAGIRIDHRFKNNDTLFGRYNRSNINALRPEVLPTISLDAKQYAQAATAGYTHLFGPSSILSLHYGYLNTDLGRSDPPAGDAFTQAINFAQADPNRGQGSYAPQVTLSNGYSGVNQSALINGPQRAHDYHADYTKIVRSHTINVGGMFYRIYSYSDSRVYTINFTQNATSQAAQAGSTGLGPASFLLGLPDSVNAFLGNSAGEQTVNWYGSYAQDQWQVSKNLVLTFGLRWDYVAPAHFSKVVSALNPLTGEFLVSSAVPPLFPHATAGSGLYNPQYNGLQPRFGLSYTVNRRTVFHVAFAKMDDHNNPLIQQNNDLRVSWPNAVTVSRTNLNRNTPSVYLDQLPPESSYLGSVPQFVGYGIDPNNHIPYSLEYNAGVQQQISNSMVLNVDYVGSVSRHQSIGPIANTAPIPGPGTLASRGQPFPQYGGPFTFDLNGGSANYNALQAKLKKDFTSGLMFLASYTWSKSLDIQSDAYSGTIQNIYNLPADWGPSDFDRRNLFVLSGVYQLPIGHGRHFLSNANSFTDALVGGWQFGTIASFISGAPFTALAGGDVANVGGGTQRAQRIGNPYSGIGFQKSISSWVNRSSFMTPPQYTFGNERRNALIGPGYQNVDMTLSKWFSLVRESKLEFRAEAFNLLNRTNYGMPNNNVQSPSFGQILASTSNGRILQFAAKIQF